VLDIPREWANNLGLPVVGLTDEDAATIFQEFFRGADSAELRDRWETGEGQ
jgi:hypothetical protein